MNRSFNINKNNVSLLECIKSWFYFLKRYPLYPLVLANFYRAYDNYITMTVCFWKRRYPIKAALRNGKTVTIKNERTLKFPWHLIPEDGIVRSLGYEIRFDTEREITTIRSCSKNNEIRLHDSINNGDIFGIFLKDQYGILPVNDAIVVDVGANIGDSAIYFALQGAKRIIAVDPFPHNYVIAKENVELNKLSKKINVILAGCASESCFVSSRENSILNKLKDGTQVTVSSILESNLNSEKTFKVKLFSLTDLLNENDIYSKAILKMDCQGLRVQR